MLNATLRTQNYFHLKFQHKLNMFQMHQVMDNFILNQI